MHSKRSRKKTGHNHGKGPLDKPSMEEPVIASCLLRKFSISEDVTTGATILTGYGRSRFCIENYKNILEYTDEVIKVQTKEGKIYIYGNNLVIAYYRDDSMCIIGRINKVEYR